MLWTLAAISRHAALLVLLTAVWATGCAPARLALRPVASEVEVRLDPAENSLAATANLQLSVEDPLSEAPRRASFELALHPKLIVESVELSGAGLRSTRRRAAKAKSAGDDSVVPTALRLVVEDPSGEIRVTVSYRGTLSQDADAGEKIGEIHNFAMAAHVGEDGIYLDASGYWYPSLVMPDDVDPSSELTSYRLITEAIEGFELVAGLERDEERDDGRLSFSSPFPLDGMVLLGGPLERTTRRFGERTLHAVLAPGKQAVAKDVLDASVQYLERYEPIVGPYPFTEFTVLEAFFSSGFAFPAATQIAGSQLSEYRQYRRHGYLDHELLHNWWGNGIFVDPADGNWCEALASYMGNYYGHVLDGDEAGARKERRNQSNFLSAIEAENDRPLGTFGLDDGAGRGVGYQKGAAVFHMLERKIGFDAFSAGLRRLTEQQMGNYIGWEQIREAMEDESGVDLTGFFDQWVRRAGAPQLTLNAARWEPGDDRVEVELTQGTTDFELDVPLRLYYGERSEDLVVPFDEPTGRVEVPCEPQGLTAIELDPDYHLFRKLKPDEVMPTSLTTRRTKRLVIVVPDGALDEGYEVLVETFTEAITGDPDEGGEVEILPAANVTSDDLRGASLLVLGAAATLPQVDALLSRTRSPVAWNESAFSIEGREYPSPGHAVLLTVHHPDLPGEGITVYRGNSATALANARVLTYYPNSLLVFETPLDAEPDAHTGMPRSTVIHRADFEFHDRIEFDPAR